MNGKKKCALAAVSVLTASLILAAAGCGEVKINTGGNPRGGGNDDHSDAHKDRGGIHA